MQWSRLRVKVILAALLVTLVVLFGGQWLYLKYSVQQPLRQILAGDGTSYRIVDDGATLRIYVHLDNPSNLMEEYQHLNEKIRSALRNRSYQLIVEDERNQSLREAYYQSQFAIHTAIARGDFENMARKIERNAAAVGAEAKVWIDGENVYVYMCQGEHYLVEVVPRAGAQAGPGYAGGGGLYAQRA